MVNFKQVIMANDVAQFPFAHYLCVRTSFIPLQGVDWNNKLVGFSGSTIDATILLNIIYRSFEADHLDQFKKNFA